MRQRFYPLFSEDEFCPFSFPYSVTLDVLALPLWLALLFLEKMFLIVTLHPLKAAVIFQPADICQSSDSVQIKCYESNVVINCVGMI